MDNKNVNDEITDNIDNETLGETESDINKDKKHFDIEIISKLVAFLAGIYTYINGLHMVFYSLSCQEFYGVPKEYFYNNSKYVTLVYLLTLIGGGFIFIFPLILKKLENIKFITLSKLDSILYSILYFIAVLSIFIVSSQRFIKSDISLKIAFILVILFSFISSTSTYFYLYDSSKPKSSLLKALKSIINKIVSLIKLVRDKLCKKEVNLDIKRYIKLSMFYILKGIYKFIAKFIKLICNAFIIISILNILVFFIFCNNILRDKPENKTNYEIATLKDGSKKVVICHYQDKVILMDFALLFSNLNELPSIDFSRGNYSVEPVEGIKFKLIKFKSACNKFL